MSMQLKGNQSAQVLAEAIRAYLQDHPNAVVKQSGAVLFSMDTVECSINTDHRRCSIYFWAENLNLRRTIVAAEEVKGCLRLTISRLGTCRQEVLWLTADAVAHPFSEKENERLQYDALLSSVLNKQLTDTNYFVSRRKPSGTSTATRKGPYVRGTVKHLNRKWAYLAVGECETSASIHSIVRSGLLWLNQCRTSTTAGTIKGLRLICPKGQSSQTRLRLGWLSDAAQIELYELDQETQELARLDIDSQASCSPWIARAFDQGFSVDRTKEALQGLLALLPPEAASKVDFQQCTPTFLSIRLNGLEFASLRRGLAPGSFKQHETLYCKVGKHTTELTGSDLKARFSLNMVSLFSQRHAEGPRTTPYYRRSASSWFHKLICEHLPDFEPGIQPHTIYRAVDCGSGRASDPLDIITVSSTGRLVIISGRADENSCFPLQVLDQWIRIRELNRSGELKRAGYFPDIDVTQEDPRVIFIAPAFRLLEENKLVLSCISSSFDWTFIGVDENWRQTFRVIFRKVAAPKVKDVPLSHHLYQNAAPFADSRMNRAS